MVKKIFSPVEWHASFIPALLPRVRVSYFRLSVLGRKCRGARGILFLSQDLALCPCSGSGPSHGAFGEPSSHCVCRVCVSCGQFPVPVDS